MLETLVFICLGIAIYHYVIYPGTIMSLAAIRRRSPRAEELEKTSDPSVTLLIAAYNEEAVIQAKIENSLKLNYGNIAEIIVIADGSSDSTPDLVSKYSDRGVVCLFDKERRGKSAALNRGVDRATGSIVLFSDANNDFSSNAISELAKHFVDPTVGGVTGAKKILIDNNRQASAGDSLYWKYEAVLKSAESDVYSITCSDGEIFAMRRELYKGLDTSVINDDLELTLGLVYSGYKVLYEPMATSTESASVSIQDDFWVKVRMVAGGFQAISRHWRKIFNITAPFSMMFVSHKVIRWIFPVLMIVLLASSMLLLDNWMFGLLFLLQLVFYGIAVVGWVLIGRVNLPGVVYVPFYFTAMNTAALFGLCRFLFKSQGVNWRKAVR
jgi:cellulose synthase/poly-beta-1,6-N-acetylglucosamine synthase-like glycosyltransferase